MKHAKALKNAFLLTTVIVAAGVTITSAHTASAAPIVTLPTDLSPGAQYRLIFWTDATTNATSNDINTYNDFVTSQANGSTELAALGTTWCAVASTSTTAARDNTGTNFTVDAGVPIYTLGDNLVADNNQDLWRAWTDPLYHGVDVSQSGATTTRLDTFTGTTQFGERYTGKTLGTFTVRTGLAGTYTSGYWIEGGDFSQFTQLRLFAMSGILTAPVPEPSSLALLGLGGLLIARRRR